MSYSSSYDIEGNYYEGNWVNFGGKFMKHGYGKMIYANGEVYEGNWNKN